jgi:hypothetical protein
MPYLSKNLKTLLAITGTPKTPGGLNYMFTELIKKYLEQGLSYQKINDVVGALEGAKMEFYHRIARPYEDKKIEENGDVY